MSETPLCVEPLPFTSAATWKLATGAGISNSGALSNTTASSIGTLNPLVWSASGTTTDIARLTFKMPKDFDRRGRNIFVDCSARKVDSSTDENSTLALTATISWLNPGSVTLQTLTTAASYTLPAAGTGAARTFTDFLLDIGQRLRAEGKKIEPGALCSIALAPSATVGSSDMVLEVLANVVIGQHPAEYACVR